VVVPERSTIDNDELKVLQELAKEPLALDHWQLGLALAASEILEIGDDDDKA
jgi:hypothetical protein